MLGSTKYFPVECIYCGGVMRVPQDTPMDTKVQCPVCAKSFKAKLALSDDAPIAKTLDAVESDVTAPAPEPTVQPNVPASGRLGSAGALPKSARVLKERRSGKKVVPKSDQVKEDAAAEVASSPVADLRSESSRGHADLSMAELERPSSVPEAKSNADRSQSPSTEANDGSAGSSRGMRTGDSKGGSVRRRSRSSGKTRSRSQDGWNQIGVDGLPISRSKEKTPPLEEHDGGEGGWREVVLIVIGGAISLPVTQLCLWWLVGVDPLQLGPSISRVVPQVVPAEFQSSEIAPLGPSAAKSEAGSSTRDGSDGPVSAEPETGESESGESESGESESGESESGESE